jgi:hypothetical protein
MRRLLVEPPRTFADAVTAAGEATCVAVTEPGATVALPHPSSLPGRPPAPDAR